MNIKKLFAVLAGVSMLAQTVVPSAGVFGAEYSEELQGAYNWAYSKGVTTMSSIDNANMYGAITRAEMAKMLSVYAESSLGITADTSKACTFTDIDSVKGDLHDFIIKSCQLGIMGQGITAFRPYDTLSRAEFGTALSRVLWGDKYEGGTPYYANHLNALKAAGIMNQIANAESTKEVRGYVMLMLQRSEGSDAGVDCDDPVVALACSLDTDECPAACKEDNNKDEDEVVKSGDLDVEVSGSSNGNLFIGRDSELDTITLKTSEEVTISKIVLERIGYSTKDNIVNVKLEDSKGATIADAKTLDSKGQVKLTLKKDYKVVNGEFDAIIVVNTLDDGSTNAIQPGATVGFKVVDVESTAKNLNISGKANTYSAIKFDGSKLTFSWTPSTSAKDYNWEAGELYEVAKFKVQSPDDSSIVLRGFTFGKGTSSLDLRKYFDKAEVTVAGEKVSGLEASVNKDDELVVTFKDVEVSAKTKSEVIVKIALTEDFDQFSTNVKLALKDFVAVDGKVESRVSTTNNRATNSPYYGYFTTYNFKWGKIKLANVKLGNIDAAQNSEDIIIAEGTITVPETLKGTFTVEATGKWAWAIKQMTVSVNGEETDANPTAKNAPASKAFPTTDATDTNNGKYVTYNWATYKCTKAGGVNCSNTTWVAWDWTLADLTYSFTFNNVEFDKSGKIKFSIDTYDNAAWNGATIDTISIFKADRFITWAGTVDETCNLKYDESNKDACSEVSGSISFSKVTIQPAKASMTNSATKDVEFANKETNRKVVFDGTYTAKKGDVKLNEFNIASTSKTSWTSPLITALAANLPANKVTFYVFIDGNEVADAKLVCDNTTAANVTACSAWDTFNNVEIKAGESVKIKVEAEIESDNPNGTTYPINLGKYAVKVWWEDVNWNNHSWEWTANTVTIKVVEKGSVNISAGAVKETVLYKASNAEIAAFTVKPANGASETDLEEISFILKNDNNPVVANDAQVDGTVTVKVNNVTADDCIKGSNAGEIVCSFNEKINSDWVNVVVSLDNETTGVVKLTGLEINDKPQTREFKKRFEPALVWIESMKDLGGTTQFTLGVEKDSELAVRNLALTFDVPSVSGGSDTVVELAKEFDEGDTIEAKWQKDGVRLVTAISYYVSKSADCAVANQAKLATDWTFTKGNGTDAVDGYNYCKVTITKEATGGDNYADFFKVGDSYARAYKAN